MRYGSESTLVRDKRTRDVLTTKDEAAIKDETCKMLTPAVLPPPP